MTNTETCDTLFEKVKENVKKSFNLNIFWINSGDERLSKIFSVNQSLKQKLSKIKVNRKTKFYVCLS